MRLAIEIAVFCRDLPATWEVRHVTRQLFRSASGAAANYRAACRARSHREFIAKLGVSLEESDETLFWLVFLERLGVVRAEILTNLLQEGNELTAIFATSLKTARSWSRQKRAACNWHGRPPPQYHLQSSIFDLQ
jgi:four helix bundle protein